MEFTTVAGQISVRMTNSAPNYGRYRDDDILTDDKALFSLNLYARSSPSLNDSSPLPSHRTEYHM